MFFPPHRFSQTLPPTTNIQPGFVQTKGWKEIPPSSPFYTLAFHPSAIQAWPLSEQIRQFNFIVARGLTMVSSLWNVCDNQIERAHVYLPWRAAAQISSTLKRRAPAGVGFFFLFFLFRSCKLIVKCEMRVGSSLSYSTSRAIKARQPKWRTSWQLCKISCLQIMPLGTRLPPRCCQEPGERGAAWKWVNSLSGQLEGVKPSAGWIWLTPRRWEGIGEKKLPFVTAVNKSVSEHRQQLQEEGTLCIALF